ncbi:MAG: GNAT family N-acetyltransferase [Lachnospiraceae bacterium]
MNYQIRQVQIEDLDAVAAVEADCFPAAEAADKASLEKRIRLFPESFFVAEADDGRIVGFVNGCVTNSRVIEDEMFEQAKLHQPDGDYQSIFGLDVIDACRRQGVAAALMEHLIEDARARGRKGLILTCKEHLIHYYEKFGYQNLGVSRSVHGGAVWYDMILEF